mmetsp:Transcript_52462/g.145454  ORF Transcript_52462/g.145454 Transcript_52462/m.145454 type:complete len:204 (+) Transcript_52462:2047-2658(+)
MSSASLRSFSTSGTAVAPLLSAASRRAQASQSSSVLARSIAASATWRLKLSRAMAARIPLFDIPPRHPPCSRSDLAPPSSSRGCFAISAVSFRSKHLRDAGRVSLCHWRLTRARARRAHGRHFDSRSGVPSSEAPAATSTSRRLGQSANAPGSNSRSATERRARLSGAASASASRQSSSARKEGTLPHASSKASNAWLRSSAW